VHKALIYLRVSTREQAERDGDPEGYSLPAQREACQRKSESLGAVVVDEYVDRGESAKTADRPGLRAMLQRLKDDRDVDFVIVHKVDRLARNRADDVTISLELQAAGVTLVSCTESIDETPSGKLVHGIMASIAEFYSRNLANEVMKGTLQKVKTGGTPTLAPLGYLNVRLGTTGTARDVRTVVIDPERAPIITWAFEAYASGEWTLQQLLDAVTKRGLRSRATARRREKELDQSVLHRMLRNPYYMGVVRYKGVDYQGKHEPLVTPQLWDRVQSVLTANQNGQKQRKHPHYLKGTVWCAQCGSRLSITHSRGRGGVYPYFVCLGRHQKRTPCTLRYLAVDVVERWVEERYGHVNLLGELLDSTRDVLLDEVSRDQANARAEVQSQERRIRALDDERRKLLHAHYAGAVPLDLLKEEQSRIGRELEAAHAVLKRAGDDAAHVADTLEEALRLTLDIEGAYLRAPDAVRRQFNAAFFEAIWVDESGIARHRLASPFRELASWVGNDGASELGTGHGGEDCGGEALTASEAYNAAARPRRAYERRHPGAMAGVSAGLGVKDVRLVELWGIEPQASSMRPRRSTN
jgi:site-specific DNA recombinase